MSSKSQPSPSSVVPQFQVSVTSGCQEVLVSALCRVQRALSWEAGTVPGTLVRQPAKPWWHVQSSLSEQSQSPDVNSSIINVLKGEDYFLIQ